MVRVLICDDKHVLPIKELSKVCVNFCPWGWWKRAHFEEFFHRSRCGDLAAEAVLDSVFNKSVHTSEADFFSEVGCCFYNSLMACLWSVCGRTIWCPFRMMFSLCASDNSGLHWQRVCSVCLLTSSLSACYLFVVMALTTAVFVGYLTVSVATLPIVIALGVDVEMM